ncbi:MAG: LytR C-terminal domain-containing protein [Acidimicrobiia bacterium]
MTDAPNEPTGSDSSEGEIDLAAIVSAHNDSRQAPPSTGSSTGSSGDRSGGRDDGLLRRLLGDGSSSLWRYGYPAVVAAVLVVGLPLLVFVGLRVILDSTDGQLVRRITDPTAPGYEAVVSRTPTALVAIVGADNTLSGVALLSLTSESSGGVITMPSTLAYPSLFGQLPVSFAWEGGGVDGVAEAVGTVLNLSFTERLVIRASEWPALMATTGPLSMTLPDPVKNALDVVVLPKGSTQIRPDQVALLLDSKAPNENELNRSLRHELFWKAWLAQLRSSGGQVAGPIDAGLGRFVGSLSRGQLSVSALPVTPIPPTPPFSIRYVAVPEPAAATVAAYVPFPEGAPGSRPRLRSLDGTGALGNGVMAAIQLNAGVGQVDVVGNAKKFGQPVTQIIYFDGTSEETARRMRDAIDIGELVPSKESNSASDITVILGQDYLTKYGPSSDPATAPTGR